VRSSRLIGASVLIFGALLFSSQLTLAQVTQQGRSWSSQAVLFPSYRATRSPSPRPLPTLRCRLMLHSLCEATPSLRQMEKQQPVGIIRDRLCQHEALGTAESTLFGIHMASHTQNGGHPRRPKHFGAGKVPANHNVIN
jgi:hypothetical protein